MLSVNGGDRAKVMHSAFIGYTTPGRDYYHVIYCCNFSSLQSQSGSTVDKNTCLMLEFVI